MFNLMDFLKDFFSNTISDEEVAAHDWILCPYCNVNIMKEDFESNDSICPSCGAKIEQNQKKDEL